MKYSIFSFRLRFKNFLLLVATLFAFANVAFCAINQIDETVWTDIRDFGVEGRGWSDVQSFYDRLPEKAEKTVPEPVWNLSHDSAGMLVRFVTDATELQARWTLRRSRISLANMTAIGASGLDLYVRTSPTQWHWLGFGPPKDQTNSVKLISGIEPVKREFMLYLPLYNGVTSVEIGIPRGAKIEKAGTWGKGERKPIVFYGTSILQGASASRPGMVHSAILGRRFNWPTINLGFSGNGRMEIALADLLSELDASVYVLDCLPNMSPQQVKERVEPFVHRLRETHPNTPIVLVEDRAYANALFRPSQKEHHAQTKAALKTAYANLKKNRVKDLYYIPRDKLFGDDGEGTTDGSHPSDLGFMRQADVFAKTLKPLLKTH